MTLDETFTLEHAAYDQRFKMIAAAGGIADFDVRAGDTLPDQALNFTDIHRDYLSDSRGRIPQGERAAVCPCSDAYRVVAFGGLRF
jgi:hypothetical protein